MINDFMYIGHIMGQDCQGKPQEAVKVLPVRGRWDKPGQLEHEKIHKFLLLVFVYQFRKHFQEDFDPNPEIARVFILCIHKALLVDHIIEFFQVALYNNN